jgi:hypothetical protein
MIGTKRFGELVLLVEPLPKVDQLAALRAERPEFFREPIAAFPAVGAGNVHAPINHKHVRRSKRINHQDTKSTKDGKGKEESKRRK